MDSLFDSADVQLVILVVLCSVLRYSVDSAQELNTGETIGLHTTG